MAFYRNKDFGLVLCVLALVVVCFLSVARPMWFQRGQQQRERAVRERMTLILRAEQRYKAQHGTYTADLNALVKAGLMADSLRFIPFSDGKTFHVVTDVDVTKSGRQVPTMSCSATYSDYLGDMDKNSVANLIEEANEAGRFPGIRMGDMQDEE